MNDDKLVQRLGFASIGIDAAAVLLGMTLRFAAELTAHSMNAGHQSAAGTGTAVLIGLALLGLCCGIMSRTTIAGKAGLWGSLLLIGLGIYLNTLPY